jgi:lysophospholipase
LLLALAACGRDDASPFVDSRPPPGLAERFYPPESWAWGLVAADGGPAQRYGVAAPRASNRAQLLILPGYGETAETWFETAGDLNRAGYTVWVLEGVGQGGSTRLGARRDLGELKSFEPDVAAVRGMIDSVIRPGSDVPLILIGQGVGALVAARAVEEGARPDGLILSAPDCAARNASGPLAAIGLGGVRAPGSEPWRRDGANAFALGATHDAWRGDVTHAWQVANPDLRMGGPSLHWVSALAGLQRQTVAGLPGLGVPVLIVAPEQLDACLDGAHAERRGIAGAGASLELEDDGRRDAWLGAVRAFVERVSARPGPETITRRNGPFQARVRTIALGR